MTIFELIGEINYLDLDPQTSYESYFKIFNMIEKYPTYTTLLKSGTQLYRSRTNLKVEQFRKFSELSYPPQNLVNSFSRANRPQQSFFYASESEDVTYSELLPFWTSLDLVIGDSISVTTGQFRTSEDFFVTIIPDYQNKKMKDQFFPHLDLREFEKEIVEVINKLLRNDTLSDPNIYQKTSAFFNTLRVFLQDMDPSSNGFLFCSVQNKNLEDRGWNLVLDPSCVDNFCKIERVFKRTFTLIGKSNNILNFESSLESNAKGLNFETNEIIW